MRRGVALVLVMLVPALAHAEDTDIHVEVTDVTITGQGTWGLVSHDNGWDFWRNAYDDARKEVVLGFAPPVPGACATYGDAADVTDEYAFEPQTVVWDAGMVNGMQVTEVCTEIGGNAYTLQIAISGGGTILMGFYAWLNSTVHEYISAVRRKYAPVALDPPPESDSVDEPPANTYLRVDAAGLSFDAPGQWQRAADDVWSYALIPTVGVAFEAPSPGACAELGASLDHDYFADDFTSDVTRIEARGGGGGVTQIGACIHVDELAYGLVVSMPDGMNPHEVPQIGMLVHAYAAALVSAAAPEPETPGRRGWLGRGAWPHAIVGGLVRRAHADTSAWGGGLAVTRRPWHPARRFAVGYDLSLTAASGWVSGAASVHPGLSVGTMHPDRRSGAGRGVLVDAYLALGVEATGGAAAPATGVTATFGAGIDGAIQVYGNSGVGLDVSFEILADPSGYHSHSEGLALNFGRSTYRLKRLGVRHVGDPATGSVWWFTLGLINTSNDP